LYSDILFFHFIFVDYGNHFIPNISVVIFVSLHSLFFCRWFYRNKICKYSEIHIISSFISDNHQNSGSLYSVGWWLCAGIAKHDMCRNQNEITFRAFSFCFLVYFCSQKTVLLNPCFVYAESISYDMLSCWSSFFISIIFWLFSFW
jgi:hypothetical protein